MTKHIFIVGSKGIPAKYGGFETFVDQLTERKKNSEIQYHIACLSDRKSEYTHNEARCFEVKVPRIGSARAVLYDVLSLWECIRYIKKNKLYNSTVYILACRIGPFFYVFKRKLSKMGVQVLVNPDGHEWKRGKWNAMIKRYWKLSERLMVKHADLLVCDSKGIEQYIQQDYAFYKPNTHFIAYGADITKSTLEDCDEKLINWMERFQIWPNEYYLIVGRFVPENNYEFMITEFMKSNSNKDLIIITGVESNPFYQELFEKTNFTQDKRVKFVGTVYDQQLLKKIRELAYGYLHGHEVGGTNPSLLEALASTQLNLLYDIVFNREVGEDGAVYFIKEQGSLAKLIDTVDQYSHTMISQLEQAAKHRIAMAYAWESIVDKYERIFVDEELPELEREQHINYKQIRTVSMNEHHV